MPQVKLSDTLQGTVEGQVRVLNKETDHSQVQSYIYL